MGGLLSKNDGTALTTEHMAVLKGYGMLNRSFLTQLPLPRRGTYGETTLSVQTSDTGWQTLREYLLFVFGRVSDKTWLRYEVDVTARVCTPSPSVMQLSLTLVASQRVPYQLLISSTPGQMQITQGALVGTTPEELLNFRTGSLMKSIMAWFGTVNGSLVVGPNHPIIFRVWAPAGEQWGKQPGAAAQWTQTKAEFELNEFLNLLESASSTTGIPLRLGKSTIDRLRMLEVEYTKRLNESITSCSGAVGRGADVAYLQSLKAKLDRLRPTLERLALTGGGAVLQQTVTVS